MQKSKITLITLFLVMLLSLFLNIYKKDTVPLCFNADEAAFGYNAYSILKTGKDEYGSAFPLRLKSFGDFKMPLYSYLSTPFIALFGLNETSTRMLNTVLAFLLPLAVFLLARELFASNRAALIASFLSAISLGLGSIGRQAHEGYLVVFLLVLTTYFFLRLLRTDVLIDKIMFFVFLTVSMFSYQSGRVFAVFFFLAALIYFLSSREIASDSTIIRLKRKVSLPFLFVFFLIVVLAGSVDIMYKPTRVSNLLFFNNEGFTMAIQELRIEGGARLLYNKATEGIRYLINEHLSYFSPQFLVTKGDENPRFGLPGMTPITVIEYLFFFIGIYYLFKLKYSHRYFILFLALVSALPASLSWAHYSLTRSLFLLIPIILIASFGIDKAYELIPKHKKLLFLAVLIPTLIIFSFYSWDFYLNHYTKRSITVKSWQCGYKELAAFVKENYDKYDRFYITKENGQPYIFLLFYLQYSPDKYQKIASLSKPDDYGFGQVEKFDKFVFSVTSGKSAASYAVIGFSHDMESFDQSKIKKIAVNGVEIFQIYENQR